MKRNIFIKLLGEGEPVYKTVPASEISPALYKLDGSEVDNSSGEQWEHLPGTLVFVEELMIEGKMELTPLSKYSCCKR